jgi:hypothetical protein
MASLNFLVGVAAEDTLGFGFLNLPGVAISAPRQQSYKPR